MTRRRASSTGKAGTRPKVRKLSKWWCAPCGKTAYATKHLALEAAVYARRYSGEEIRAYREPKCKNWHIGHPIGSRR